MSAVHKVRRTMTARESAEKLGVSPRTIQRVVAEPREEFLSRSRTRQDHALALKDSGLKYTEISERMGCTPRAAESLVYQARKRREIEALRNPQKRENPASEVLPGQTSIEDVPGE